MVGRPHRDRGRGHPLTRVATTSRVLRGALVVATAAYAVVLWVLTLRPVAYGEDVAGFVDRLVAWFAGSPVTAWLTFDVVEFAANVALFVPFGMLALLWRVRWWLAVLLALATSGAIETVQLLWLPERVADVRDLVSNTLGAALGVALLALTRRLFRASSRRHGSA